MNDKRPNWLTEELLDKAVALGPTVGRTVLQRELGLTDHKARILIDALQDQGMRSSALAELQYLRKEVSQLRERHTAGQTIASTMENAIKALPALEIKRVRPEPANRIVDQEDVVLLVSDVHIGYSIDESATGGLGVYNHKIFRERMRAYQEAIVKILRYTPSSKQARCYIFMLGDIVEGSTVYRGQQRQIDLTTVRQVVEAGEQFSYLVANLLEMFKDVTVVVVPGNHARIGLKGENAPADSWDWLVGYHIKLRFENEPRVRVHLPDTWWALVQVQNTRFLLTHGDDIQGWMSTPYYGAERFVARMRQLFVDAYGQDAGQFDMVVCGHHHKAVELPNVIMNGNWVGGSEFSLKRLQAGDPPHQWMLGVHEKIGISWSRKLLLWDRKNRSKINILK